MKWRLLLALSILVAVSGCEDPPKKDASAEDSPDAGSDPAIMDQNLAEAMKSAQLASTAAPASTAVDGPPPNGVFGPGLADKAHAPDAPLKVELLGKGSEPYASVRPPLELPDDATLVVEVAKRVQTQMLPGLRYTLGVALGKGEEGAPGRPVSFTIKKVQAENNGLDQELAKLKGAKVAGVLADDGSLQNARVDAGKDASGAFMLLDALREQLELFFCPWPAEPVGKGAYWMATDRTTVNGIPVVRYRVVKIEQLSGDELVVSLDLRQYSADAKAMPMKQKMPENLQVMGFNASGRGTWTRHTKSLLPSSGQLKAPTVLQLGDDPQNPQRMMPLQIEAAAAIVGRKQQVAAGDPGAPGGPPPGEAQGTQPAGGPPPQPAGQPAPPQP